MNKLEEKLIELGYKYNKYVNCFSKKYSGFISIFIELIENKSKTGNYFVEYPTYLFNKQEQIDNLQQAFNEMQNDLAILKECEE